MIFSQSYQFLIKTVKLRSLTISSEMKKKVFLTFTQSGETDEEAANNERQGHRGIQVTLSFESNLFLL